MRKKQEVDENVKTKDGSGCVDNKKDVSQAGWTGQHVAPGSGLLLSAIHHEVHVVFVSSTHPAYCSFCLGIHSSY
jgi:hypothetical protein